MKRLLLSVLGLSLVAAMPGASAATVGQPAPDFTATAADGKPVRLSESKGKYVVLEWINPNCPYVQKHYNSGNMPALQKEFAAKDVVWLAVSSTNRSHQDYMAPGSLTDWVKQRGGQPLAILMDSDGALGRLYGARVTPHMYVVDPQGRLVYAGAIDDKRGTDPAEVKAANNFVKLALSEAMANKPLSSPTTNPYGCSVKY